MLVISAGMQKSGSGYLYNLVNDLEIAGGKADAREIKCRHGLENIMLQHNNNIGPLHLTKLLRLWWVSIKENDFVVKTHSRPDLGVRILNRLGLVKMIYCYRDPRDVLLSAIDHGKKSLAQGTEDNFIHMIAFDVALRNVSGWVEIWKQYYAIPDVLLIKYEDLMNDPRTTIRSIQDFLGISLDSQSITEILWKYSKENPGGERTGMHFNKAITARYKTDMSEEQQTVCRLAFAEELKQMGYVP